MTEVKFSCEKCGDRKAQSNLIDYLIVASPDTNITFFFFTCPLCHTRQGKERSSYDPNIALLGYMDPMRFVVLPQRQHIPGELSKDALIDAVLVPADRIVEMAENEP